MMNSVTEKFLLSLGFQKNGQVNLPDWYNIFELDPVVTTCDAFSTFINDMVITIFITPKGVIGESCLNDEYRGCLEYFRIDGPQDVINLLNPFKNESQVGNR